VNSSAIRIFEEANGVVMATRFWQNKLKCNKLGHNFGPMQTTFGICVQMTYLNSLLLNKLKRVLPWQPNFEKKEKTCTDFMKI